MLLSLILCIVFCDLFDYSSSVFFTMAFLSSTDELRMSTWYLVPLSPRLEPINTIRKKKDMEQMYMGQNRTQYIEK